MSKSERLLSRRDFLKLGGLAVASLAFTRIPRSWQEFGNSPENSNPSVGNSEFLSDKTIEIEGKFRPDKPVTIYNFPLRSDSTFDPEQQVSVFEIPSQANLSYRNFYFLKDSSQASDRQVRRMTILPNTMGVNNLTVAELDYGKFNSHGDYLPAVTEHPGLNRSLDNILGDISYIVGDEKVYPNKTLNLLNAMSYILEYQEQSGPLLKNNVYSYLELIRLADGTNYLPGYTSTLELVRGGGICAGATAVANAYWVGAKNLGVNYENTYQKPRYNHPQRYKLGPFGPDTFITDTTVQINGDGTKYDYLMIPPHDLYIDIKTAIIPNGVPYSETNSQGLYVVNENGTFLRSDIQFVLNVSLTTEPPRTKAEDLRAIRQKYIDFRSTKHQGNTTIMTNGCRFLGKFDFDEAAKNSAVREIYPEEDVRLFSNEIARSDYLQDIFALQQILNSINRTNPVNVAQVVRNSDWYRDKINSDEANRKMETAINQLNTVAIMGQPVQCIAWATLLAGLPYPNLPISIGSADILGPNDLIPASILTRPELQTARSPTGGTILAKRDMEIGEINSNDLFLIKTLSVGHVGVILCRKQYDGKQYLLVTESNRHNDGRIQIYTLDEYNFNAKLGSPPNKKILLRK